MNWTIAYNGIEKTPADWGLAQLRRRLVSQGIDEFTFQADGTLADSPPLFPHGATLVVWRDRLGDGSGNYSGGQTWFQGLVTQVPRAGAPETESLMYKVAGPWWYLDNLTFQQAYQNIFLGYAVANDPTTAIYGPANSSHLFLNQAPLANALQKITTGEQIIEALNWALQPFITAGVVPPFQIGAVTPAVDVPIDEVRDLTCAEVIHKMLRWSPDAVTWFDYSTTPPTFNCQRRADMAMVNLPINSPGSQLSTIRDFNVNARYDLQAPSVQIFYETSSQINGQSSLSLVKDFYPDPLPTDPQKQFASLQFTVDLQGLQASVTTAKITCEPLTSTDPNWWLGKHPQYQPFDSGNPADAGNSIASFEIDPASIQRAANPATDVHGNPIADLGYTNELTTGQLTDWMTSKSQRLTLQCKATVVHLNGTQPQEIPLTFQCLSTNAHSGTFQNQQITAYPEPVPVGLARFIYDAISVPQFEGTVTLQEAEGSGSLTIGKLFNLTGGALAEWGVMAAMVQGVTENLEAGTTQIQFGPPRHLGAGELVDLLRVNRSRIIRSAYSMRPAGTPGDSSANVDLGQNTPEKNSVSGSAPANPQVISHSVDGTGAVISHASDGGNCATQWLGVPVLGGSPPAPGSITISLADAGGNHLKIQPISVCMNGVTGTLYGLFSQFIPDA